MRRRGRVDTNHEEIVEALRKVGWNVLSLAAIGSGVPDLLIHRHDERDIFKLVEVKTKAGKLTDDQKKFHRHGWPVVVVRSVEDALHL